MPQKLAVSIGERFGKLVVTERAPNNAQRKTRWLCRCDCGKEKVVAANELKSGDTSSCGCNYFASNARTDLSGLEFGRLTALFPAPSEGPRTFWHCECSCGNSVIASSALLTSGKARSCGCLRKELATERHTTHGGANERLHGVWNMMRQRCQNPRNKDYDDYGGRGITVCQEWNDYAVFRSWALLCGYSTGLTIDRKNNDGNYCPENCRWIPLQDQMKNRRSRWRERSTQ